MNFWERINAVLHHRNLDKVPFAPYDNLIPRGDFEREMRNRGMGLCARRSSIQSETPEVWVESYNHGDITETIYHTPVGSVSTSRRTRLGRLSDSGSVQLEWMIKDVKDYEPVIFMIENTVFHFNNNGYYKPVRDLGVDGIVRDSGLGPPYDSSEGYFGLFRWATEQYDHPEHFARLLEALERRAERLFPYVANSPAEFISFGGLSGSYGPKEFEEYTLPFYQKYVPLLHEKGKICAMHAHASNLSVFKELIAQTGIDVIEAFTPPPIGDLSVAEARKAWGDETIIWVNFPETVFLYGESCALYSLTHPLVEALRSTRHTKENTKEYTIDILKSDPSGALVIGMTELGLYGIADEITEQAFKSGVRAIMDAIDECSRIRQNSGENRPELWRVRLQEGKSMNFLERINAVLHHQKCAKPSRESGPDKVPFAPSENLIPRGDFERELRNRGMGLYAKRATYWSETPNVRVESKRQVDGSLTIYHTPVGSVSTGKNRRMIEDVDDYEPVIFMVKDTVFHADYSGYSNSVRDLGADGIVRGSGIEPPLEDIVRYIGAGNLEKEQRTHPEQFAKLLKALEQRTEKLLPLIEDSPSELIPVGEIGDAWTPEQFKKYILPFYQKYVPRLHEKGKIRALDVRTSKLKAFKDLIPQIGIDVVEGFTPPPIGDLSLEEARATWGKDIIIWLNFPETILLDGAEKTREYTINLLKSYGLDGGLVIGLTSMKPITDEATEQAFKTGLKAILDAIEYRG